MDKGFLTTKLSLQICFAVMLNKVEDNTPHNEVHQPFLCELDCCNDYEHFAYADAINKRGSGRPRKVTA